MVKVTVESEGKVEVMEAEIVLLTTVTNDEEQECYVGSTAIIGHGSPDMISKGIENLVGYSIEVLRDCAKEDSEE